ncbi:MAG: ABC transporter ATP-binding protein [bacterium]|nr:ABC transporter ATP-binding protein [bacterium]
MSVTFEIEKLRKTFGGLVAVDDVDIHVREGTIHAIIGPNGAGKTTLFNAITNVKPADSGEILLNGEAIQGLPTHVIISKGIARTFQNIRLFPYMTVLENVKVGTHILTKSLVWGAMTRNRRFKQEEQQVKELGLNLLEKVNLLQEKDQFARNLPYGKQRKLEIVRALASQPQILLLDEPAAGMNNRETADLDDFIQELKSDGLTLIVIEHDMKLVMSIADVISVIDYGVKIAEGTAHEIQNNEQVIDAYLGKRRTA